MTYYHVVVMFDKHKLHQSFSGSEQEQKQNCIDLMKGIFEEKKKAHPMPIDILTSGVIDTIYDPAKISFCTIMEGPPKGVD